MTFVQNLGQTPNTSGIYGQPAQADPNDTLSIVNRLKDREMQDFQNKANFMSDLDIRQRQRMQALFPPEKASQNQGQPNVVMGQDPNQLTGYQKGELGIRQQGVNIDSQRLAQQGQIAQGQLGIKAQQEALNKQKSDQINATKQADMQRKIDESNQKIELAQQALTNKTANAEAQLQAHKDLAAAVEERHKLEMANKDAQFKTISDQHQQTIDALQERLKQSGRTKTTVTDSTGATRTTTSEKGDAADSVQVIGKDGGTYTIPKDKLNDMDSDGTPHWKPVGGSEDENQ